MIAEGQVVSIDPDIRIAIVREPTSGWYMRCEVPATVEMPNLGAKAHFELDESTPPKWARIVVIPEPIPLKVERRSPPSGKAIEAALTVAHEGPLNACTLGCDTCDTRGPVRDILLAAHDPELGRERSVRLGDVIDALRIGEGSYGGRRGAYWTHAATFIAEKFGGS